MRADAWLVHYEGLTRQCRRNRFRPCRCLIRRLSTAGREFVSLVGAVPEIRRGSNCRTTPLPGESAPPTAPNESGPDRLTAKDQILQHVKGAFTHAHKTVATLANDNLPEQTADPFNPKTKRPRVDSVGILSSHTFDDYGEMVEYARMNGMVGPQSVAT
jgi:hypothetical protein